MRSASLLAVPILLVLVLALGAASAGATTFCVETATCIGTEKATIQAALDAAAENSNPGTTDLVRIGDHGGVPFVENLSYTDPEPVEIVGAGRGVTEIESAGASVTLTMLNPAAVVRSLTLFVPDVSNGTALRWNGTASDIQVIHDGSAASPILGMRAEDSALLEDSVVSTDGAQMFETSDANSVMIVGSALLGGNGGVRSGNEGTLTIEDSQLAAKRSALQVGSGMTVNVFNTVLRSTATEATVDATLEVLSGTAVVRHATVYGKGFGTGLRVNSSTANSTLNASSSIVEGFQFGLACNEELNQATLNFTYSNRTDATNIAAGCSSVQTGSMTVEPSFVSAAAIVPNLALKAPSALIDAGEPGDPLSTDILGAARVVDGDGSGGARSDMGAYEYQRRAPVAKLSAEPIAGIVGAPVEFSAKGSTDPDPGDTLSYSWDFGDGTSGSGLTATHTFTSAGTKIVTLTVTDSGGAATKQQLSFPVTAPEKPQPEVTGPPRITGLRAVPKRIVLGPAAPKLLAGSKAGIRFAIDGSTRLKLTLQRCKGKAGCAKRARVRGSVAFDVDAGQYTIRFKGTIGGRTLAPGRYLVTLAGAKATLSTRLDLVAPR